MNVLSLFSGAGGLDLGLERAGMTLVGHCEIDPTARQVLARHWPDVPCHPDVTTLDGRDWYGRVDVVAGGSPCTDLSLAGRRAGLAGEHSGLFWHQCRIAAECSAGWVVWENVYGALSSNAGEDFAAVLWGLTGFRPAVPADGWRTVGVCAGPDRTAVWRVFDAQWFGVAQRRRRVFVVAGPGNVCGPEVLVEPESVPGGPRPSRTPGTGVAALTSTGVGTCGADDNQAQAGHLVTQCPACGGSGVDFSIEYDRPPFFDACRNCGGSTLDQLVVDLAQVTSPANRSNPQPGDPSPAVASTGRLIAFTAKDYGQDAREVSPTLRAGGRPGANGGVMPAVAYPLAVRGRTDGAEMEMGEPDIYNALRAGDGGSSRQNAILTPELVVRRLTPVECERLMGWPDSWTAHDKDGRQIADSHRYRMCGNGVVASVAEWIGRRIVAAAVGVERAA